MEINSCIKNLLKLICVLQNNSENNRCNNAVCDKPFLGPNFANICYNTRVITLYNKQGELFTANYDNNGQVNTSTTFRVLKVDDDSCTLLILNNIGEEYFSTKQTIIVNLKCICAVKCNGDINVNNL